MHKPPSKLLRISITLIICLIALILAYLVYHRFYTRPWTRDGQVRAIIIKLAPRISGPIIQMHVKDNQYVKEGDLLFEVDPSTYKIAVENAFAQLEVAKAKAIEAQQESQRQVKLGNVEASKADITKSLNLYAEAKAAVDAAQATLDAAKLNLIFTKIYAPTNGYVTNLIIGVGSYVTAGTPIIAIVDTDSYWVSGFFKETAIKNIKPGNKVLVKLLGFESTPIKGVVNSIGMGIARDEFTNTTDLLPSIKPTIDWVRLAQRIPVKVNLTEIPKNLPLVVGMTATVIVLPEKLR